MQIAVINDSHFGVRNDAAVILQHQRKFFEEQFFPYLEKNNIDTILHLGDLFDRRKYVNYKTLQQVQHFFFDYLYQNDIKMYIIAGNHDVYYKDTNDVNSLRLIANQYPNIYVIDHSPEVLTFDQIDIGCVPWICKENQDQCYQFLQETDVDIIAGHFEICGFEFMPGIKNHEGQTKKQFSQFEQVWSGHFHHKSTRDNIYYLGAQYELTWSDVDQRKGFHVFDTKTQKLTYKRNKDQLFYKLTYDDNQTDYTNYDVSHLEDKFVKVIVENKSNHFMFDQFIDSIQNVNPFDLTIVEEPQNLDEDEQYDINQTQDTMTILENYVDSMDVEADKSRLKSIVRELHSEALAME